MAEQAPDGDQGKANESGDEPRLPCGRPGWPTAILAFTLEDHGRPGGHIEPDGIARVDADALQQAVAAAGENIAQRVEDWINGGERPPA